MTQLPTIFEALAAEFAAPAFRCTNSTTDCGVCEAPILIGELMRISHSTARAAHEACAYPLADGNGRGRIQAIHFTRGNLRQMFIPHDETHPICDTPYEKWQTIVTNAADDVTCSKCKDLLKESKS